jgi:hypothetical protein
MEIWKPVLGNDAYEVSDQGRVRRVTEKNRGKAGMIMKQSPDRYGYMRVRLSPEGKRHRRVHRLMWEAFCGPIPEGLMINHESGIKSDNRLGNFTLVTRQGNADHAVKAGLVKTGDENGAAKLTDAAVRQIRAMKSEGMTGRAIARNLGLPARTVHNVISGRNWSSVV